jgi:transcriptional regulator with XRE-family HTH domain
MRKERLAHGWSLREFHARTGIDIGHASRIETGKVPPTEKVAKSCDDAWPERRGWFLEYYEESKSWIPAGFRSWAEHEDKAATLRDWYPGILTGLLQTEGYARAVLSVSPAVSDEVVAADWPAAWPGSSALCSGRSLRRCGSLLTRWRFTGGSGHRRRWPSKCVTLAKSPLCRT